MCPCSNHASMYTSVPTRPRPGALFDFLPSRSPFPSPTFSLREHRVKRVYRRQLSVPLVGNDEIVEEAKEAFAGDDAGFKEACHAHAKANKMVRGPT